MNGTAPSVSVVVPVYNDPAGVEKTLESLAEQTYPDERHEVVVVDNGSTDETPAVTADIAERVETVTLAFERTVQGSYAARNRGIEVASGELLLFVDADVTVPETWIADVAERFRETEVDYLGCAVDVYQPGGRSSLAGAYNCTVGFPVATALRNHQYVPTCCLAVRRTVIDDLGAFRPDLVSGGDREFGERVAAAGYSQAFAPDVVVRHPARCSFGALLKKAVRVGRGQEQLQQRYSETATSRPFYHPRSLLPPDPRTFSERLSRPVGPARWFGFYLLAYLTKLVRQYGRLRERYAEDPSARGLDAARRSGN